MTPDTAILTTLLNTFVAAITGGYARIAGDAMSLLKLLALLEIALAALWWMLTDEDAVVGLIKRILVVGLFIFFVTTYPAILSAVLEGFVQTGLKAGGGALTSLTDPSAIVEVGLRATQPILDHVAAYSLGSALANIVDVFMSTLAALLVLLAYFAMAVQVFLTYVEFYVVAVLGLILVPFGVFRPLAFLAERVVAAIISFGIRLMVLAFVLSIALPVLRTFALPPDPTWQQDLPLLLASGAIAFLAWHAPTVAASLIAGSPSLTTGLATGTALGAAVGAKVLVQPALAAGRAAANLTLSAARAGLSHGALPPSGGPSGRPGTGSGLASVAPTAGLRAAGGAGAGGSAPTPPPGPPPWAQKPLETHREPAAPTTPQS